MSKTNQTILYIHGFNSGPGGNDRKIAELIPNYKIIAPQLTNNVKDNFENLSNILKNELDLGMNVHIVGTSLGGFYALLLKSQFSDFDHSIEYYLINPSLQPYKTLKNWEGKNLINFRNGKDEYVPTTFIHSLSVHSEMLSSIKELYNVSFFLGLKDEILDFEYLKHKIKILGKPYWLSEYDEGHSFKDINPIVDRIKENSWNI